MPTSSRNSGSTDADRFLTMLSTSDSSGFSCLTVPIDQCRISSARTATAPVATTAYSNRPSRTADQPCKATRDFVSCCDSFTI